MVDCCKNVQTLSNTRLLVNCKRRGNKIIPDLDINYLEGCTNL